MVFYILKSNGRPFVLIGTAPWIAAWRKRQAELLAELHGRTQSGKRLPCPVLPNPGVMGVMDGGEAEAAAVRAEFGACSLGDGVFPGERPNERLPMGKLAFQPEFARWLLTNTRAWDGRTDAELLGVRGFGRSKTEVRVKVSTGLGGRLACRRRPRRCSRTDTDR